MENNDPHKIMADNKFILQLYVSGMSLKSLEAIENVKRLCDEYLKDAFELEIIDLYKNPEAASAQQIVFSPSLIKLLPLPKKVLVGTFKDEERVIKGLGILHEE